MQLAAQQQTDERPDRGREVGERIRARRVAIGLSQETAAANYHRATGNTLTRQGWAYWESYGCSLAQIDRVAEVLDTTAAALLGFA